jgi:hypothetical protein
MKRSLFSLVIAAGLLPFVLAAPRAEAATYDIDTIFSGYGLQRTKCKSGNYVVITVERKEYCAFPTAQYPAGVYRLEPNTHQIYSLGGAPQNAGGFPNGPSVTPLPVGGPAIPVAQPAILNTYDPYSPISPVAETHIRGMLAKRGISLASCSQTPLSIFTIGQYTACAYPSINYPAGRYQVDASFPF